MLKIEFQGQFKKDYKLALKRGCHIEPDRLLIYQVAKDVLVLRLIRTGTHSDLF